jgi:DNA-binding response OmpR family regulator
MYEYLRDKSVLYVEDEVDILNNISNLLKRFFKKIYTATNGSDALDIFYTNDIDILLVDIEMPKMSGIELIKEVRQTHENVKIIIISAYTKTDYLLESIEFNLSKYIVKPLTSDKIHLLLETLNNYYKNHNSITLLCGIEIDRATLKLKYNNKEYPITKKEFYFLERLSTYKMVTYYDIISLWTEGVPSDSAIRSFIKHLRRKLPNDILKNRSGEGYYIECN